MQWPPTSPGRKGRKFHLLPAAFSTSSVSMPRRLKMSASSLMRAMLTSRCVFSMTLAASATRMLEALWVPAVTIEPYSGRRTPQTSRCRAGGHLADGGEAMLLVARVDPLRAVAGEEVTVELKPRHALEDRHAHLLGAARVDRRLVDHHSAAAQHLADALAGASQRREVRALVLIDRRRHGHDEDLTALQACSGRL